MYFLILPNQLYDFKYIKNVIENINKNKDINETKINILIWEHPHYFKDYNFNKKKLLLHRASMKYYYDYIRDKLIDDKKSGGNINISGVSYLNFNKKLQKKVLTDMKKNGYLMFDPINKDDVLKLPLYNTDKCIVFESPNFLLSLTDMGAYRNKTKSFFFNPFYMWSKKRLNIIPSIKSKDKDNRKKLPKGLKIPELPTNISNDAKSKFKTKSKSKSKIHTTKYYINSATRYVKKHFPNNYGTLDNKNNNINNNEFIFPIDHKGAHKWLKDFIKKRFSKFGDYQDFIDKDTSYLFHSVLSSSINIGLLNPTEIVNIILEDSVRKQIPINSYEVYIRQLFWREYQRYCYIYFDFNNKNYFGNTKKLSNAWYGINEKKLGIDPVDDCIQKAFQTGYLNHIERLMVVGNFMNLSGISPKEGFKWFMEFSCDSYEWVMYQNVLDMVFCVSGGKTMRRPYISSSNYILKMSNYKKGEWSEKWSQLYNAFLKKNRDKLWKFRYYFRGLK